MRRIKLVVLGITAIIAVSIVLTSCFTYQYQVGRGSQTGVEVTQKNHYLIYGLLPMSTSDPVKMAAGAADYQVTIQHSFIDGLLSAITAGFYSPTTTTVKR